MSTLLFIRHAQASFGADDYDQLSELGYTQSEYLAEWLHQQPRKLDRVVCGPVNATNRPLKPLLSCLPNFSQDTEIIDELDEFDAFQLFGWLMQREDDPRSVRLRTLMMNRKGSGGRELGQLPEALHWSGPEVILSSQICQPGPKLGREWKLEFKRLEHP